MRIKYGNTRNFYEKDINQSQKNKEQREQELKEKYLSKIKPIQIPAFEPKIKKERDDKNETIQENVQTTKEIKKLKKLLKKEKLDSKKLKDEIYTNKQIFKKEKEEQNKLKKQIKNLQKIVDKNIEIDKDKNEVFNLLSVKLENSTRLNKTYSQEIKGLKIKNERLSNKKDTKLSIVLLGVINKLILIIENQKSIISKISQEKDSFEVKLYKEKYKKYQQTPVNKPLEEINEEFIYGNIVKKDGDYADYAFCSLDQKLYPISHKRTYVNLIENAPAKAILLQSHVVIVEILKYESKNYLSINSNELIKNKQKTLKEQEEDILQLDDFNVLVVGSRNRNSYIQILENHGLNAEWHDGYLDGEQRLKERFEWADIVLICIQHVPHSVTSIIDTDDPKVEVIYRDNIKSIFARTRYALIKLGLIKIEA